MVDSISENNGLEFIKTYKPKNIYSIGISTAGNAEIQMAKGSPKTHIVATTIDESGATYVIKKIENEHYNSQIEVKVEDIRDPLPYPDEHFDLIYARLVLHYLSKTELQSSLLEIHRILKKGGGLFIVVRSNTCSWAQTSSPDPKTGLTRYVANNRIYHRYFHDFDSITSFLTQAGFRVKETKAYKERLSDDFERLNILPVYRPLIEIQAEK